MIRIRQAIVVEGRYDKNTLRQVVDAPIFETNGFGIMKDAKKLALLRQAAARRGLIVFTDADGAGLVIRNYLKSVLPKEQVLHAYIPDIPGKERRKRAPGKEGKLGVEGMTPAILVEALRRAGAEVLGEGPSEAAGGITKADLYELGFSGGPDSAQKRRALQRELGLPENLGAGALLDALNLLFTRAEFLEKYKGVSHD